jgi:hypothetical protein
MTKKEKFKLISELVEEISETVSHGGKYRLQSFIDDLHWLMFERDEPSIKFNDDKKRYRIAYAAADFGGTILKAEIFGPKDQVDKGVSKALQQEVSDLLYRVLMKKVY